MEDAKIEEDILSILSGGDRRSIGRSDEAMQALECDPSLLESLFQGMLGDDPVIAMRAADVVEKYSSRHPECLQPYKAILLQQVAQQTQQEIRWHVAQMIPRLDLTPGELELSFFLLKRYLQDKSGIVRTFALQAMADLGHKNPEYMPEVRQQLEEAVRTGTPAMHSRGKKLLKELKQKSKSQK